jgi:RNA polymerase sigma-70 factor (ECF subfamily)
VLTTEQEIQIQDDQLVRAAQAGCYQAFEQLVIRYYERMLSYLTHATSDPVVAADLTQETFLDAFRDLQRFACDRPFVAWLYRIARNNLLSEWQRQHIRRSLSLEQMWSHGRMEHLTLWTADAACQCCERECIQQVFAMLSPSLREALVLEGLGGFSGQEVAQILGISHAAARQRIGRAKASFRQYYCALEQDTPCEGIGRPDQRVT